MHPNAMKQSPFTHLCIELCLVYLIHSDLTNYKVFGSTFRTTQKLLTRKDEWIFFFMVFEPLVCNLLNFKGFVNLNFELNLSSILKNL